MTIEDIQEVKDSKSIIDIPKGIGSTLIARFKNSAGKKQDLHLIEVMVYSNGMFSFYHTADIGDIHAENYLEWYDKGYFDRLDTERVEQIKNSRDKVKQMLVESFLYVKEIYEKQELKPTS